MEDYATYLADEAKSDIVAMHQFRILYDTDQKNLHLFFEGDDDGLYYMPEVRRYFNNYSLNIYDCGGKRNVISVRDSIKSEGYDIEFCLFFVDRDFDDLLMTQVELDDYTYITDYYSIENDVSNVESAKIFVEEIVKLSRADPAFLNLENSLQLAFNEFYKLIRTLSAWILAAKECGCAPNLRNTIGLKEVISISGMTPSIINNGFANFKKKVVTSGRVPPLSAVLRWHRKLDSRTPKMWVRGKYDIWFFQIALLAGLEEISRRRKAAGGRAIGVPSALRERRIFEVLGGRVPPPSSLRAFLERRQR